MHPPNRFGLSARAGHLSRKPLAVSIARLRCGVTCVFAVGLMTGCSPTLADADGASADPTAASPAASATASARPMEDEPAVTPAGEFPSTLTYSDGADLDPDAWLMQWDDAFMITPGYSVRYPDDGDGMWAYTEDDTGCEIWFYQGFGPSPDLDMTQSDDTTSDQWLAAMNQVDVGVVEANAWDDAIAVSGDGGLLAARALAGRAEDGSTRVDVTRVIGSLQAVFWYSIGCPSDQDALTAKDRLEADMISVSVFDASPR